MPEAVHVADLEGACLALGEVDVLGVVALLAGAEQRARLHEPAHGGVAGHRSEPRILARERDEVVVVELVGPPRMVRAARAIASASAGETLGCVPAWLGTLRASTMIGSTASRAA